MYKSGSVFFFKKSSENVVRESLRRASGGGGVGSCQFRNTIQPFDKVPWQSMMATFLSSFPFLGSVALRSWFCFHSILASVPFLHSIPSWCDSVTIQL